MRKTVEIPIAVHKDLKVESAKRGVKINQAIEQAIRTWLVSKPTLPVKNGKRFQTA